MLPLVLISVLVVLVGGGSFLPNFFLNFWETKNKIKHKPNKIEQLFFRMNNSKLSTLKSTPRGCGFFEGALERPISLKVRVNRQRWRKGRIWDGERRDVCWLWRV